MKFVWWSNGIIGSEVETYKMLVHPFGATSSPFCANYALRATITDHKEMCHDQTISIANRNIYVDDCIASVEDVGTARMVIKELSLIMRKEEVLSEVPAEDLAKNVQLLQDKGLPTERALGVE